jgi:hypothetical protein
MQDVFEPKLNFGGEVFEPMNFDGDYSNFGLDPVSAGLNIGASAMDLTGKIVDARARKKEAEAKIKELAGKRGAELTACENNRAFKKFADKKYRRNRINDCQKEVRQRNDKEEAELRKIANEQIGLEKEKISLQRSSIDSSKNDLDVKKKKNLILGLSIGGGVLVIGAILFFVLRKK